MKFVTLKNNPFIFTDIKFPWADTPQADTPQADPLGTHPPGHTPPGRHDPIRRPLQRTVCILLEYILLMHVLEFPKFWEKLTSNQHSDSMIH